MKLLLYSHPFAPQLGGLERLTQRTAELLSARGVVVDVVTDTPGGSGPPEYHTTMHYRLHRSPSTTALWKLVRRSDVVQLNSFDIRVFVLATLLRRPLVWQHVDFHTVCPRGTCVRTGSPCTFRMRRCWVCLRADHSRLAACRTLAAFAAKLLASHRMWHNIVSSEYSAKRLHVSHSVRIPLGVDVRVFAPREQPPRSTADWLVAVFFGRHIAAKGAHVLVQAVAICARRGLRVRAIVAGDGPERAGLERLAAKEGVRDRLEFLGFVGDADLVELLRRADTVVVPAIHDEYYGLTAAEALSCGVPVVASAIGSLPEVVGDGGLLFPAGDAERLADCLQRLACEPELQAELGRRARKRALASLSDEDMIDGYLTVYQAVWPLRANTATARSS